MKPINENNSVENSNGTIVRSAAFSGNGGRIYGKGSPGELVNLGTEEGEFLGSGEVRADGKWSILLDVPRANGEKVYVSFRSTMDDTSENAEITAPDFTPPPAVQDIFFDTETGHLIGSGAVPGQPVRVFSGRQAVALAMSDATGAFSIKHNEGAWDLADVKVHAYDAAGNRSEGVSPDLTPPDFVGQPRISGDGLTVYGNTEPGTLVSVYKSLDCDPCANVGSATTDEGGNFIIHMDEQFVDGSVIYLEARDAVGNLSQYELKMPDIVSPQFDGKPEYSADDNIVHGKAEAGSEVEILLGDDPVGYATVDANGEFRVKLSGEFGEASQLRVVIIDSVGNSSEEQVKVGTVQSEELPVRPEGALSAGEKMPVADLSADETKASRSEDSAPSDIEVEAADASRGKVEDAPSNTEADELPPQVEPTDANQMIDDMEGVGVEPAQEKAAAVVTAFSTGELPPKNDYSEQATIDDSNVDLEAEKDASDEAKKAATSDDNEMKGNVGGSNEPADTVKETATEASADELPAGPAVSAEAANNEFGVQLGVEEDTPVKQDNEATIDANQVTDEIPANSEPADAVEDVAERAGPGSPYAPPRPSEKDGPSEQPSGEANAAGEGSAAKAEQIEPIASSSDDAADSHESALSFPTDAKLYEAIVRYLEGVPDVFATDQEVLSEQGAQTDAPGSNAVAFPDQLGSPASQTVSKPETVEELTVEPATPNETPAVRVNEMDLNAEGEITLPENLLKGLLNAVEEKGAEEQAKDVPVEATVDIEAAGGVGSTGTQLFDASISQDLLDQAFEGAAAALA